MSVKEILKSVFIGSQTVSVFQNRKPKTQRGKRVLAKREPKIVELGKQALMLRGATASLTSLQFVKDLVLSSINVYITAVLCNILFPPSMLSSACSQHSLDRNTHTVHLKM